MRKSVWAGVQASSTGVRAGLLLGPLEETPQLFITHANQQEQGSARQASEEGWKYPLRLPPRYCCMLWFVEPRTHCPLRLDICVSLEFTVQVRNICEEVRER